MIIRHPAIRHKDETGIEPGTPITAESFNHTNRRLETLEYHVWCIEMAAIGLIIGLGVYVIGFQ